MDSGKLNKRITIEVKSVGKGASGGLTSMWSTHLQRISAAVRPLSGNERNVTTHGGKVAEARTEFVIRYRNSITEQMRVAYRGKYYNILHIKDQNERHEWLTLTCDTGVNDG